MASLSLPHHEDPEPRGPSSFGSQENSEKVLFADDFGDRRKRVDSDHDQREIIQCIGRIHINKWEPKNLDEDSDHEEKKYENDEILTPKNNFKSSDAIVTGTANNSSAKPQPTAHKNEESTQSIDWNGPWPINITPQVSDEENDEIYEYGTGTVFKYDHQLNYCYVLTCAHVVVQQLKPTEPKKASLTFQRVKTLPMSSKSYEHKAEQLQTSRSPFAEAFGKIKELFPGGANSKSDQDKNKPPRISDNYNEKNYKFQKKNKNKDDPLYQYRKTSPVVQEYDIIAAVHSKDYNFKSQSSHDLAVLIFYDHDLFYRKLFMKHKRDYCPIRLLSGDDIDRHPRFNLTYELYGYPVKNKDTHKKSVVKDSGLYGMATKAVRLDESKQTTVTYHKDDKGGSMFYYSAIDTEPGQSGSALFIECIGSTPNNQISINFGIVGVHTGGGICGKDRLNWAVGLTKEKIEWINAQYSNQFGSCKDVDWKWDYCSDDTVTKINDSSTIVTANLSAKGAFSGSGYYVVCNTSAGLGMSHDSGCYKIKFKMDQIGVESVFSVGIGTLKTSKSESSNTDDVKVDVYAAIKSNGEVYCGYGTKFLAINAPNSVSVNHNVEDDTTCTRPVLAPSDSNKSASSKSNENELKEETRLSQEKSVSYSNSIYIGGSSDSKILMSDGVVIKLVYNSKFRVLKLARKISRKQNYVYGQVIGLPKDQPLYWILKYESGAVKVQIVG